MVKADLTRDYYADLQLQPGADIADIKKQFKKLALAYHPDRNPGRENEVTAQFQAIQSAHEVLTDPTERAKYDNNRVRGSGRFGSAYAGSSGVRGNPWSDVSSQYPPPPKAPTARRTAQQPSSGAERYKKWDAPKQSAYQAAQEGAGARQKTYEAWESMKTRPQSYGQSGQQQSSSSGSSKSGKAPQVPPRAPQSDSTRPAPTRPRPQPARASSPPRRSNSTTAFKKGFMPNTPGGDEPAASKGAYFTAHKSAVPPDLPARDQPPSRFDHVRKPVPTNIELQNDSDKTRYRQVPTPEPRISTPYATHGGEKLNPFENSNLHRSKSARESPQRFDSNGFARNESDSSLFRDSGLFNPNRSNSMRQPSASKHQPASSIEIDSDSSDDGPEISSRSFGKARSRPKSNAAPPTTEGQRQTSPDTSPLQRTPSKIAQYRKWYKENPNAEPPPNGFPSDGAQSYGSEERPDVTSKTNLNGEPSMYAFSAPLPFKDSVKRSSTWTSALPTVLETSSTCNTKLRTTPDPNLLSSVKLSDLFARSTTLVPSRKVPEKGASLTAFEGFQRNLVNHLLHNRGGPSPLTMKEKWQADSAKVQNSFNVSTSGYSFRLYRDSAEGSSSGTPEPDTPRVSHSYDSSRSQSFWKSNNKLRSDANEQNRDRFSFNINNETFQSSNSKRPSVSSFNSSAENISTKFSSKEWDGKFEGGEFFQPDPKAPFPPSRTQSGSRSRGRSPIKPRVDPRYTQTRDSESEPVLESPGGAKFSPQEWADTFKPQTFAPPPPRQVPVRRRTGTNIRPTQGGNAAVVDDSETSDEKPLFDSRKTPSTPNMVPADADAMDVDIPQHTVPQFVPPVPDPTTTAARSPKRPAAPSPGPPDEAGLKVNFDDLQIKDLLSTLNIPTPPAPPSLPDNLPNTRPSPVAYEDYCLRFAKYMTAWDLYNNQFLLHLVARKNQNDASGAKRWMTDEGLDAYRRGLKEDAMVLGSWKEQREKHDEVVKEWVVLKEKMKEPGTGEMGPPPRKKAH